MKQLTTYLKFLVVLLVLIIGEHCLMAQEAYPCYYELRQEGIDSIADENYRAAIKNFIAARICLHTLSRNDLDSLIQDAMGKWEDQKNAALDTMEMARISMELARDTAIMEKLRA